MGAAATNTADSMRRGSVLSGKRIKIINVSQAFLGAGIKAQYRGLVLVRTESEHTEKCKFLFFEVMTGTASLFIQISALP